jgi:cytochrome c-type biogenesis protein
MPDLTLAAAMLAGLLSFLSPCVLPVVPAYLGQLGALTVAEASFRVPTAAGGDGAALAVAGGGTFGTARAAPVRSAPRRWHALFHSIVFVLGFGGVFTLLGVTASYVGQGVSGGLPFLRQIGGVLLIVMGLNVMGVLRLSVLMRSWRPLERFGSRPFGGVATRTPLGAFGLGAVFALGWTPCVGPTLGAIFGLTALGPTPQAGLLFVAYSAGLGIPFILLALALDRAPAITRPLVRHGRLIEVIGGALIVVIGVAILTDLLGRLASTFSFLWPQV